MRKRARIAKITEKLLRLKKCQDMPLNFKKFIKQILHLKKCRENKKLRRKLRKT